MAPFCNWMKSYLCCRNSAVCGEKQKRSHLYCGCRERRKQLKMTCESAGFGNDRQILVNAESADDVLEYNFVNGQIKRWEIGEPTAPFHQVLDQQLNPHSHIFINGTVLQHALSFTLNLCIKKKNGIAFHFNPRFDQAYTARNSLFDGKWGKEEGISHQGFPFCRNESFTLEIFLTHDEFMVAVNGLHYCSFVYRFPLLDIDYIEIIGDVILKRIVFDSADKYPNSLRGNNSILSQKICHIRMERQSHIITECVNKLTPFIGLLEKPLNSGSEIEISGTVRLLPYVFSINLQQGSYVYPHPIINLHVSIRFNQLAHAGNHVVLCNAWNNDQGWGTEEFAPSECPFVPGSDFVFKVLCRDSDFVAWVDDRPLFTFKHRFDFKRIDTIYVQGEMFIKHVKVFL